VEDVSDHYPVYAVFRTDLPDDDPVNAGFLPSTRTLAVAWGMVK
jgi:hypothetical protein